MSWFSAATGFTLREPQWLWLAVAIPLLLAMRMLRHLPALRFAPAALAVGLPKSLRQRLLWLPGALQVTALVAALLALARPVERIVLPRELQALDILLLLDVSSSMTQKDLDPLRTRLDVAKEAAAGFVARRAEDRIGLILFARYPDLRCPLTLDHTALAELLAAVAAVEAEGPEDATGIGTALARAAQTLQRSQSRSKIAILLTDGQENVATAQTPEEIAPLHAAQLCRQLGIRVYTVVAGIEERSETGQARPVDTREVEQVARLTGGAFFAVRDAAALARVYAEIDALERSELTTPRFRLEDRFAPFLLGALLCGLAAAVLRRSALRVLP